MDPAQVAETKSDQPNSPDPRDLWMRRARAAAELIVATILVVIGIDKLRGTTEPGPWMPIGLIALALLIYTLRGRGLSELAIGKDGISVKIENLEKRTNAVEKKTDVVEQKAEAAGQQAEQATQAATLTKEVVAQVAPKPSARRAKAETKLRSSWDHPGLAAKKVDASDPQKGQWGGQAERNDRKLSAKVAATNDEDWFSVSLEVRSTSSDKPLTAPVRFHLHDTFNPAVVLEEPEKDAAKLHRYAVGAFTVGAEVKDEPGTYLELDLATLPGAPKRFREN